MAVNSITPGSSAAVGAATTRGLADIKTEDFFKLLIAQLQSQDPLNPTDNQAILEQMSMIRQLESSTRLNQTLDSLAAQQRLGTTAALIGTFVTGVAATSGGGATPVAGVVVGVTFEAGGQAVLELHNGQRLPASRVETVTLVENLPEALESGAAEAGADSTAANATTARSSRGLLDRWLNAAGKRPIAA